MTEGFRGEPLELTTGASKELVLLRHELLVGAARAAQVGCDGPPLVDDHDSLVGSAGCAPAVLAMLHFLLLALCSLVVGILRRDRGHFDLFLAARLPLWLAGGSQDHAFRLGGVH